MRIPARIIEHPIEAAIAGLLLLALLFGSADFALRRQAAGNRRPQAWRKNCEKNAGRPGTNFRASRYLSASGRPIRNAPSPFDSPPRVSALFPKIQKVFAVKAFCLESGIFGVSSQLELIEWRFRLPRRWREISASRQRPRKNCPHHARIWSRACSTK